MIWVIIIGAVIFFAVKIFNSHSERAVHVEKEGGMHNKYRKIVDTILAGDPRARIFEQDSVSMRLGCSSSGGTTEFQIIQGEGCVDIYYELRNSPLFGNTSLKWSFPEYMDQEKMLERIFQDLEKNNNALMSSLANRF